MTADAPAAVVLLSGGLDSVTVLALAAKRGFAVHAMSFAYGQRHLVVVGVGQVTALLLRRQRLRRPVRRAPALGVHGDQRQLLQHVGEVTTVAADAFVGGSKPT